MKYKNIFFLLTFLMSSSACFGGGDKGDEGEFEYIPKKLPCLKVDQKYVHPDYEDNLGVHYRTPQEVGYEYKELPTYLSHGRLYRVKDGWKPEGSKGFPKYPEDFVKAEPGYQEIRGYFYSRRDNAFVNPEFEQNLGIYTTPPASAFESRKLPTYIAHGCEYGAKNTWLPKGTTGNPKFPEDYVKIRPVVKL
ncbi:MAG: hypothetical protein BGO67_03470 [Alphaproteobacteria bacterium 41-28]|nr:MAG: hypothetical protein BGO67_03470 [Alphaproteobacteria bacterium 41-28]